MEEYERHKANTRELNIVLKELRKVQLGSTDEAKLRKDIAVLEIEIVKLKTTLSITASAIAIVWAVFGSFIYAEIDTVKSNTKAIIDHTYRLKSHKDIIDTLRIKE